jgi:adenylate kinase family enzyme
LQPQGLRVREPLRLAILGLPGAGKTTLTQELARRLCGHLLSTGGALRALAATDASLAADLASGGPGPEALVIQLVQEAVRVAGTDPLIVDGFPRYAAQVVNADRLLGQWVPLLVEVTPELAADRLAKRALPRPEDSTEVAQGRLQRSKDDLSQLTRALEERGTRVLRVDGTRPLPEVVQSALDGLESHPPELRRFEGVATSAERLSTTARRG